MKLVKRPPASAATELDHNNIQPLEPHAKDSGMRVSLDIITEPAYMLDYNFQVNWCNGAGLKLVTGGEGVLPPRAEERNVFQLINSSAIPAGLRDSLIASNVKLARSKLTQEMFEAVCAHLNPMLSVRVQQEFLLAEPLPKHSLADFEVLLDGHTYRVYSIFLREGIFVVYEQMGAENIDLPKVLARRDVVIREVMNKRLPVLTDLAVMVADLQDSVKICSELPPEEYFELFNQIWQTLGPIFRRRNATHGKHVGDGMVYYFFPQPESNFIMNALLCAQEARIAMRRISEEWRMRKKWLNDLCLNIGLGEGEEWVGTYQIDNTLEIAVLGDTINHTARLSDVARSGSIWATKNLLCKLTPDDRRRVRFGVCRKDANAPEHFVESTYIRVSTMLEHHVKAGKIGDIAGLTVTEVIDVQGVEPPIESMLEAC
ncbi:MAG TPA: adenylate/guanylate cyclase domain-containing protein [Gallionella sp.]|nr:adenylate/guanylate cyclase domain-containing protein [Gallionella sp.]